MSYDQWQVSNGSVTADCPPGWACDQPLLDDGFMQRNVTDVDGHKYIQTVITDRETTGLQLPAELAYVNETFVSLGHGGDRSAGQGSGDGWSNWDGQSGIAFNQRLQEIDEENSARFFAEVRGTTGLLLDPTNELFIRQELETWAASSTEQFDAVFMLERGLHDDRCCDAGTESRGRHDFSPGHLKGHKRDKRNKRDKRGKGNRPDAAIPPGVGGHYGETLTISQSLVAEDFNDDFSYVAHSHSDSSDGWPVIGRKLDISTNLILSDSVEGTAPDQSAFLLEQRTGRYQTTENSDFDPFDNGAASLSWTAENGIKHISLGNLMTTGFSDIDRLSGYESLEILDPFDDVTIAEASNFSLVETGPWIDRQEFIDPFI